MSLTQKLHSNKVPLFCPLCKIVMSSNDDYIYYTKYTACKDCSIMYAEPQQLKWKEGWRPSKEEIKKNDIRGDKCTW